MKIFNEENGVKKVYVQMNDIMMLTHSDLPIPGSVFEKVFTDIVIVNDNNRMDFVEFNEPDEVNYFKSLDWIVDYKEIRDLSEEEIKNKGQEIANEMNRIAERYNSMSNEKKHRNQSLIQKHELLDYKIQYLAEILWVKQGYREMPFPIVPDSDSFTFKGDENSEYEIRGSLDPNKILLYRKDGKELSNEDKIPLEFIQMGMSIAAMERSKNNIVKGDYEISKFLSEDNKYLVIEYKIKSNEKDKIQESHEEVKEENVEEAKEEKGIKKLIKRFLKRK